MTEQTPEMIELESIVRQMEAEPDPDMETIADLHVRIEELKATAYSGGAPGGLEHFEDLAASQSYVDPDGQGQQMGAAVTPEPAIPKQPEQPAQPEQKEQKDEFDEGMRKLMKYLIETVVVKAYNSATFTGKNKLPKIVTAAMKSGGPNPLGRISFNVKRGFDKAFDALNYSAREKNIIIYHLVLGLEDNIYMVEHQDPGAARILKSMIAKEHLPGALYDRLDKKGAFS